jgi:energy-converting hydrogenase Eha subunit A
VPATLVGHGLAYAVAGRSVTDAHHAWLAPALECSLALLVALCSAMLADALLKAGILMHTAAERSTIELFPRLALAQLGMFAAMERLEGTHAGLVGCVVQVLVALCVAYVLSLFSRLLVHCIAKTQAASQYLQRLLESPARFVSRRPYSVAYALAVRAGNARFQRPPPLG